MNEKNAQLLSGLRDLCAFIEANDDFEFVTGQQPQVELSLATWHLCGSKEEHRAYVCDLARRVGKAEKRYADEFFWLRHDFNPLVRLVVTSMRDVVCERVVTGREVIPAQAEQVLPAIPERTVEVVTWKCAPILAAETELTSA